MVINGLQDTEVRSHILRNSACLSTNQAVRLELLEMARAARVLDNLPQAMDIGALPKGGKEKGHKGGGYKGKGKGSKGTGKGSGHGKGGQGRGKGAANHNKDVECHYCHKKGHIKADCRKRSADEKGKKGAGKGKTAAAVPQEEPQGEPIGTIMDNSSVLVAGMTQSKQTILVDTGAGSNLFVKTSIHMHHPQRRSNQTTW